MSDRQLWQKLQANYRPERAEAAYAWWLEHTSSFRVCISDPYRFVVDNEYIW
jgi:hypothetical protein